MRNQILSIMACCVALAMGSAAQPQSAPDSPENQAKALEALRQAEHHLPGDKSAKSKRKTANKERILPVPVSSPEDQARALEALRQAERGQPVTVAPAPVAPAPVAPAAVAPVPAPAPAPIPAPAPVSAVRLAAPASSPADERRALEALHQAEHIAPPPAAPVTVPAGSPSDEARALEAVRQAERGATPPTETGLTEGQKARQARREAEANLRNEEQRKKEEAAGEKARAAKTQEELAAKFKLEEEKKKLAAANPSESAEAAAKRKKAQEDVARRLEKLQRDMKPMPANATPPAAATEMTSKQARLADLLRRYQADEITPLQYHTERAKIVAEP